MKEFIKKCPFVFSLFVSMILVMDFCIVKYELIDLKLNQDVIIEEESTVEIAENVNSDGIEMDDVLVDEPSEAASITTENDPLLKQEVSEVQDDMEAVGEFYEEEEQVEIEEEVQEEPFVGVTEFLTYEPEETHSPYYKDPGKKALTTTYPYSIADETYFDDAAFIGDSRTIGLFDYAGFDGADFYAENGFCAYLWKKKGTVTLQNTHEKVNLDEALSGKQYGKIYLMVGMNDCGYGNTDTFKEIYEEMIEMIEEKQPNATVFLVAIMNVTKEKSQQQNVFTASHINAKNVAIAECANGINRFYLDYNDLYSDEEGYMQSNYSFDGIHLYGNKYEPWVAFFKEHAIVKESADAEGNSENQ